MPPDDSKLARLLPGIASQKAVTQESAKKQAAKGPPAALPSAYAAERKERVGWLSVICLAFALLGGSIALALSSMPKSISADERRGGSPLIYWYDFSGNILLHPQGDTFHGAIFALDVAFWLLAALSLWGACHWIIVRWYSRRWRFSLADMLAMTAAISFLFGVWRMDGMFASSEQAQRMLQTLIVHPTGPPTYRGPLVSAVSEHSRLALIYLCLAGASAGINLFHIVDRYALQMRQLK